MDQLELETSDARLKQAFQDYVKARWDTVTKIRAATAEIDRITAASKDLSVTGGAVSVTGGIFTIAAGILTFTTAGAAAPLLVVGLGAGLVGGGLRIGGILKDSEKNGTLKNLETTLQQDVTRYRKLKQAIQCDNSTNWVILRNSKIVKSGSSMGTLLESIDTILPNLYCIQYNSQEADDLLKNLVTVACGITEEAMNTPAGRIALEQIEREGVRDEQTKRQAFESARRAVAQRLRRNNRSGLLTVAETGYRVGATNAARLMASSVADDMAVAVARAATRKTVETMAKIAGSLTVGLGAVFVIWDVVNMVKDSQARSVGGVLPVIEVGLGECSRRDI